VLSRTTQIKVSWGHCDPAGIIYYPNYFRWFDACTHGLLEAIGLDQRVMADKYDVLGLPLVDAGSSFVTPTTFGDVIQARTTVEKLGRASVHLSHVFHRGEDLILNGHEVRVWTGPDPQNPELMTGLPLPDDVRALLSEDRTYEG
jgi:4-hydroxybenzoyl-CoA thioesterase